MLSTQCHLLAKLGIVGIGDRIIALFSTLKSCTEKYSLSGRQSFLKRTQKKQMSPQCYRYCWKDHLQSHLILCLQQKSFNGKKEAGDETWWEWTENWWTWMKEDEMGWQWVIMVECCWKWMKISSTFNICTAWVPKARRLMKNKQTLDDPHPLKI